MNFTRYLSRGWLPTAVLVCLLALLTWRGSAVAAPQNIPDTITVNTATLSPTENGDPNDNKCDLREALQAAFNAANTGQPATFNECTAGSGTVFIVFDGAAAGQTITMPAGGTVLPFIKGNVTLTGPITLAGSGYVGNAGDNNDSRLLRVASGGTLNLAGLNISQGFTSGGGGAILGDNNSTINAAGVSFTGNTAYGDGGAINSAGTVNILASNFSANRAYGQHPAGGANPNTGYGGAIYISGAGSLNLALSNLSGNTADKGGGALFINQGTAVTISDSNFAANVASGNGDNPTGGGALSNKAGSVSLTRTTFNANLSLNGYGGAIFNQLNAGSFVIEDSSFNANVVQKNGDNNGYGGAIYTEEDMSLTRSTFNANVVQADNGRGGAIANNRTAVLRVTNSTFIANAVTEFASLMPAGAGGAIANDDSPFPAGSESTVELRNVTLSLNKAADDAGLFNANGESIKLWNTILDHGVNAAPLCSGAAPQNMGNNIQSEGTSCGVGIQTADPKLNPPDFNGGAITSLLSLMPKSDSPAVDAGNETICTGDLVNGEDQRAKSRPKDGNGDGLSRCDMGAIEADTAKAGFGSNPTAPGPLDAGSIMQNNGMKEFYLQIVETGNLALVVNAAISGADAASFSVVQANPITIADGDPAVELKLRCNSSTAEPRLLTATLTLTTNDPDKPVVAYELVCLVTAVPVPVFSSLPAAPGPLSAGEVVVGQSKGIPLRISNIGSAVLNYSNMTITGPNAAEFTASVGANPAINPFGHDFPSVACAPTSAGLKLATLTITTDDPEHTAVDYDLVCEAIALQPPFLHEPGSTIPNDDPAGADGTFWGIATSPDNRYVYTADYDDDLLTVFKILPNNGLERIATYQDGVAGVDGLNGPRAIAIAPDGSALYLSTSVDDAVVAFSRNPATGLLTYMHHVAEGYGYNCEFNGPCANTIDGLDAPYELAVSPDNQHLYVTAETDNAVVVFHLGENGAITDPFTGANIVEIIKEPFFLAGARGITLSPDGQHVYVASGNADLVRVFQRNGQTGRLTDVQATGSNVFFKGAGKLLVSHDGRHVYLASYTNDTVTLFERNAFSGELNLIKVYKDGEDGFDGLNYPGGMALSPDGQYLYVPSYLDDVLNVFSRSANTGLLYPVQMVSQPELDGAFGVVLGADGRTAYVAPYNTSALVILQPSNPAPAIETLLPASAAGGSNSFQLTVVGENFTPASVVQWNGTPRETTFVSESALKVMVQAADVPADPSVVKAAVSVQTPAPGGGTAVRDFIITQSPTANPVPAIAQLAPQSVPVGTDDFKLTVYGAGFIASSQVQWNGVSVPTTYVNDSELSIMVLSGQLLQAGTAVVTVQNPAPGGGASNNAAFDVVAIGQNPTPTLTAVAPQNAIARGPASKQVVVTLFGTNFHEDAQAQWNGLNRPTTVVSGTELRLTLTAADVAEGGVGSIRVLNPEPGGGASNTLSFTVYAHALYLPLMVR